jgi:hypothetical protein
VREAAASATDLAKLQDEMNAARLMRTFAAVVVARRGDEFGRAAFKLHATRPINYERAQVQPLPHRQTAPQRQPGLRVSVFFLDI